MRKGLILSLILISAFSGPAVSQGAQRGGVRTETESRLAGEGSDSGFIWNFVGLIGLLGLMGLRGEHPDDSYHPAAVE
jgi:hypothetical protein